MRKVAGAFACAAFAFLGAASSALAQETWKTEGVSFTGWPGWCSRIGIQSDGFTTTFPLEASPCGQSAPMLTVVLAPSQDSQTPGFDERFNRIVEQVSGPAGAAYHLRRIIAMNGPCVQISHEVNANVLPGLHAYEVHSVHKCERFTVLADTRNLNILVPGPDGTAWIITLDHPHLDLTADQEMLLRRTAAELAASN